MIEFYNFISSGRWWENYSGDSASPFSSIPILAKLASEMKRSRTKLQFISSTFRILVTFIMLIVCAYLLKGKISPGDRNEWYSILRMQDMLVKFTFYFLFVEAWSKWDIFRLYSVSVEWVNVVET